MANTLSFSEWSKKYPRNHFRKEIKNDEDYQSTIAEFTELTQGGNYECVYEFAQMEGCDTDDIFELIGY